MTESFSFTQYQLTAHKSAKITLEGRNQCERLCSLSLGLAGETGEAINKIKKVVYGKELTEESRKAICDELGDVLWYLSELSLELQSTLQEVAIKNNRKTILRLERNMVVGEGDDREKL